MVTTTISIKPETKEKLSRYALPRETWDDTLNRVIDTFGAVAGLVPMNQEDLSLLSETMIKHGLVNAEVGVKILFDELRNYRSKVE